MHSLTYKNLPELNLLCQFREGYTPINDKPEPSKSPQQKPIMGPLRLLSSTTDGIGYTLKRPLQLVGFVFPIEVPGPLDPLSFHKLCVRVHVNKTKFERNISLEH